MKNDPRDSNASTRPSLRQNGVCRGASPRGVGVPPTSPAGVPPVVRHRTRPVSERIAGGTPARLVGRMPTPRDAAPDQGRGPRLHAKSSTGWGLPTRVFTRSDSASGTGWESPNPWHPEGGRYNQTRSAIERFASSCTRETVTPSERSESRDLGNRTRLQHPRFLDSLRSRLNRRKSESEHRPAGRGVPRARARCCSDRAPPTGCGTSRRLSRRRRPGFVRLRERSDTRTDPGLRLTAQAPACSERWGLPLIRAARDGTESAPTRTNKLEFVSSAARASRPCGAVQSALRTRAGRPCHREYTLHPG